MDNNAFVELANREIEKLKWWAEARDVIVGLAQAERNQEKAEAARVEAVEAREKIIAATEGRKVVDAKAADKARADLAVSLASIQAAADRDLAKARVELSHVHDQTTQAHAALELAEGQRDAFREDAKREADEITARLVLLRSEEQAFRGRLTAALKV